MEEIFAEKNPVVWCNRALSDEGVPRAEVRNRASTEKILNIDEDCYLPIPNDISVYVFYFDENGNYLSKTGIGKNSVLNVFLRKGERVRIIYNSYTPEIDMASLPARCIPLAEYYTENRIAEVIKDEWDYSPALRSSLHDEHDKFITEEEYADRVIAGDVILPTNNILKTYDNIFAQDFTSYKRTSEMWQYSLCWISIILGAYSKTKNAKILEITEKHIADFIDWLDNDYYKISLNCISSADHSYAVRSVMLCNVLQAFPKDWKYRGKVLAVLNEHTKWICRFIKQSLNNHGLMMLTALMNIADMLKDDCAYKKELLDVVKVESLNIYRDNFYSGGYCMENTIGYHKYNVECFENMVRFARDKQLGIDLTELLHLLKKSREVLGKLIYQEDLIPPIGDSMLGRSPVKSILSDYYDPETNIIVLKNEERYLSYICGFSKIVHKHLDDASITLRYLGNNILIDSGMFNYDLQSPIRQFVESARGHSGLYPVSMYNIASRYYCEKVFESFTVDNFCQTGDTNFISSSFRLKTGFADHRDVTEKPGELIIRDTFSLKEPEDVDLRFCLDPKTVFVNVKDNVYLFRNNTIYFTITIESDNVDLKINVEKGVCSFVTNVYEENNILVASSKNALCGSIKTVIKYWKIERNNVTDNKKSDDEEEEPSNGATSVSIWGGCVTRDIFSFAEKEEFEIGTYIARQSIFSSLCEPLHTKIENIDLASSFQKRMVFNDLNKTGYDELEQHRSDYLFIDMSAEFLAITKVGDSYVTASSEFIAAFPEKKRYFRRIVKGGDIYVDNKQMTWCIKTFCDRILTMYRPDQIILHKSFFVDKYVDKDGNVTEFPPEIQKKSREYNAVFEFMFDKIQEYIPGASIINMPENALADENNKWGLAPIHYTESYYRYILDEFRKIVEDDKKEEREFGDKYKFQYVFKPYEGSKHLLVCFSSCVTGNVEDKHPYHMMNITENLPCNRLFIRDMLGERGTYYLCYHNDFSVLDTVCDLIRNVCNRKGIDVENVITVGSSKGGTSSLLCGLTLGCKHVITSVPQVKLGTYILDYDYLIKDMLGENYTDDDVAALDRIVLDKARDTKSMIHLLTSENDSKFDFNMTELLDMLKASPVEHEITFNNDICCHSEVVNFNSDYFIFTVMKILFDIDISVNKDDFSVNCKNDKYSASVKLTFLNDKTRTDEFDVFPGSENRFTLEYVENADVTVKCGGEEIFTWTVYKWMKRNIKPYIVAGNGFVNVTVNNSMAGVASPLYALYVMYKDGSIVKNEYQSGNCFTVRSDVNDISDMTVYMRYNGVSSSIVKYALKNDPVLTEAEKFSVCNSKLEIENGTLHFEVLPAVEFEEGTEFSFSVLCNNCVVYKIGYSAASSFECSLDKAGTYAVMFSYRNASGSGTRFSEYVPYLPKE